MNAPEKIYIPTANNELHYHMACPKNEFQESIEYIRTDAFIEKALKFIKTNVDRIVNNQHSVCMGCMDEDFKNYIKGE